MYTCDHIVTSLYARAKQLECHAVLETMDELGSGKVYQNKYYPLFIYSISPITLIQKYLFSLTCEVSKYWEKTSKRLSTSGCGC